VFRNFWEARGAGAQFGPYRAPPLVRRCEREKQKGRTEEARGRGRRF